MSNVVITIIQTCIKLMCQQIKDENIEFKITKRR
jgi:hypothetical protein